MKGYKNAPDYEPQYADFVETPNGQRILATAYPSEVVVFDHFEEEHLDLSDCKLIRKASGEWMPGYGPRYEPSDDEINTWLVEKCTRFIDSEFEIIKDYVFMFWRWVKKNQPQGDHNDH